MDRVYADAEAGTFAECRKSSEARLRRLETFSNHMMPRVTAVNH